MRRDRGWSDTAHTHKILKKLSNMEKMNENGQISVATSANNGFNNAEQFKAVMEVMDEEPHYTEKDYNEAHQTEKWTDMTFAIASRIAKHFNDINLMDGLDITYDDDDDTLWVNNYQLFRSGRIRYWGDEEAEWPELAEYLSKQPSYWFDFVNAYYFDSDRI